MAEEEFALSDTGRILNHARTLGFPVRWVAMADGVSEEGDAPDPEELWRALARFAKNHSPQKSGVVTLKKNGVHHVSRQVPISEAV